MGIRFSAFFLVFLLFFAPSSFAKIKDRDFISKCAEALIPTVKDHLVDNLRKDFAGQALELSSADTDPDHKMKFILGNLLGTGFFAGTYPIDAMFNPTSSEDVVPMPNMREWMQSVRNPGQLGEPSTTDVQYAAEEKEKWVKLIAKIGHTLKFGPDRVFPFLVQEEMEEEARTYKFLAERHSQIEADSHYPKDAAWQVGYSPFTPILFGIRHEDRGLVLVKPFIKGKSLSKIAQETDHFTPEQIEGLRDIYNYSLAVFHGVKIKVRRVWRAFLQSEEGFALDIRPDNLVWIEDPATLKLLHYRRPGWHLFEASQIPLNRHWYQNEEKMNFELYAQAAKENYLERYRRKYLQLPEKKNKLLSNHE